MVSAQNRVCAPCNPLWPPLVGRVFFARREGGKQNALARTVLLAQETGVLGVQPRLFTVDDRLLLPEGIAFGGAAVGALDAAPAAPASSLLGGVEPHLFLGVGYPAGVTEDGVHRDLGLKL